MNFWITYLKLWISLIQYDFWNDMLKIMDNNDLGMVTGNFTLTVSPRDSFTIRQFCRRLFHRRKFHRVIVLLLTVSPPTVSLGALSLGSTPEVNFFTFQMILVKKYIFFWSKKFFGLGNVFKRTKKHIFLENINKVPRKVRNGKKLPRRVRNFEKLPRRVRLSSKKNLRRIKV